MTNSVGLKVLDTIEAVKTICKESSSYKDAEARVRTEVPDFPIDVLVQLGPYQAIEKGHRL